MVAPGKHRLEFRYTGMSFSSPERVRFRYRLEGLDPDWVEAGARRTAFYSYVPPGQYRFRVIACDSGGAWNEAGASLSLIVLPHFWQARWFIAAGRRWGCWEPSAAPPGWSKSASTSAASSRMEQERALERERARIAQDLHDDLGSSLTRISLLSDLAKADKDSPGLVGAHAQKISQSADQTVRALEEIVWALRPGSDSLQSLVEYIAHFANELFEGDTTRCRLDLPHDLPYDGPATRDAAQHLPGRQRGADQRPQARRRPGGSVARPRLANALEIRVEDDGRGFEPGASKARGRRQGLGNMTRRAEAMGGT